MRIPLFPLATVLFPGSTIQLRIFEARYVDMIGKCMRESTQFGVVPIHSGNETTPTSSFYPAGVLTKIVDWNASQEGLLTITALGTEIFMVADHRIEDSGLITGNIEVKDKKNTTLLAAQNIIKTTQGKFKSLLPLFSKIGLAKPSSVESIYRLADSLNLPYSIRVKLLMSENSDQMLELVHNFVLLENT